MSELTQHQCQTGAVLRVLPRSDLLFVAYIDGGRGREQDAHALLGFLPILTWM